MPEPDTDRLPTLLIAGASVRAAAGSGVRGGMEPVCCDLFGDRDLRAIAPVRVVHDLRDDLVAAAGEWPRGSWMYTGALENHPEVVAAISRSHRLLGNPPEVLARARDPFEIAGVLNGSDFTPLELRRSDNPPPRDGGWLLKPLRSAGGREIVVWDSEASLPSNADGRYYFQEHFVGSPIAAVCLGSRLSCRLLGVTRQLVGESELHAGEFSWCGSIGPLPLTPSLRSQVETLGRRLATEFELRGLFGLDLLMTRSEIRLLEINPRYPASAEVLEFAAGVPMVPAHCLACESFIDSDSSAGIESRIATMLADADGNGMIGKAVLFAGTDIVAPDFPLSDDSPPTIADVPEAGTAISCGHPICTVFATGGNVANCLNRLFQRSREVYRICDSSAAVQ